MFRVIYRWSVKPEDFTQFQQAWLNATKTIYRNIDGALGSLLMRSATVDNEVIAIARWRTLEEWQNFWRGDYPLEMESLSQYADRISVEALEEIEDETVI